MRDVEFVFEYVEVFVRYEQVKTCTGEGAKDHAWPAFFLQNYVDAQVCLL